MIKWFYSFAKIETVSVMSERKRLTTHWVEKKNEQTVKQRQSRLFISWLKKEKWNITEKKKVKKERANNKTASSPEQDLHPDWDRFRGTILYPLSCGELALKEDILRLHLTSGVPTARNKCTNLLRKKHFYSNKTLS